MNILIFVGSAILLGLVYQSAAFPKQYTPKYFREGTAKAGEALLLTPLLEAGQVDEALAASEVILEDFPSIKSYAGYLTVDKKNEGNLFFWYFPAQNNPDSAPVVLWLQGGPGSSSMFGLFAENGPIMLDEQSKPQLRNTSWNMDFNIIYVDQPVGTGFSFTGADGFATDETKVGEDLHAALLQFFVLFKDLAEHPFFITGESYGGKYCPAIGITIHEKNKLDEVPKINLQGIAIGNGITDPINQQEYANYLYQLGLIDESERLEFAELEDRRRELIANGKFKEGAKLSNEIIGKYVITTELNNYYNYLEEYQDDSLFNFEKFIQNDKIRKAIHVGTKSFNSGTDVYEHLYADMAMSMAPAMITLLSNYRILLYNGQLDVIVAYPSTVNYLLKLKFSAAEEYKTASRNIWKSNGEVAGYVKTAGNLTEILVRNAGHMVPNEQPEWALDLITRFITNKPFY